MRERRRGACFAREALARRPDRGCRRAAASSARPCVRAARPRRRRRRPCRRVRLLRGPGTVRCAGRRARARADSRSSSGATAQAGSSRNSPDGVVRPQERPHFGHDVAAATPPRARAAARVRPRRAPALRRTARRCAASQRSSRAQAPSSSRASQARASAQCRFTVAGETPIASAVSSIESPPKNRSSTMRAWPGVELGEPGERRVERDHVDRALGRRRLQPLVERHARLAAAALQRVARARALDQDLAHRVRRDRARSARGSASAPDDP